MHKYFQLIIVFALAIAVYAVEPDSLKTRHEVDVKIDHLVREQFYTLAVIVPVYRRFTLEAEYGYLYYHRAALNIGYRFPRGHFQPYLKTGGFFQRENFTSKTHYTEACLKFGGGIEADLVHNIFLNVETSLLNYLMVNYSMRRIKFRETYEFGSSVDYTVVVGFGYRFHF